MFVNVDPTIDQSKRLSKDAGERINRIVKTNVERTGYATTWPGGTLPTQAELSSSRSRAFIVASTVKKVDITKSGTQAQIACTQPVEGGAQCFHEVTRVRTADTNESQSATSGRA